MVSDLVVPSQPPNENYLLKDWTEDIIFQLDYSECICCICNSRFWGYKRRVICKICGDKLTSELVNVFDI